MRGLLLLLPLAVLCAGDQDRDGLRDKLEEKLLKQFRPTLLIDARDCDGRPAEFARGTTTPTPGAKNGTLYGQVLRVGSRLELHYFHLWANDCGRGSHLLDAEHVAALLEQVNGQWKALAWLAAGHDGTLCDRKHGALATSLAAVDRGATVWVSHGKHASFLSQAACAGGCGADRCDRPVTLPAGKLINLGEPNRPTPGYEWIHTRVGVFQVAGKMAPQFSAGDLAALQRTTRLVSLTPVPRPAQAVLLGGNTTADALVTGQRHTESALTTASDHVDRAVATGVTRVRESMKRARRWLQR